METKELTIKVQEVISKSGIGLEIDVTKLHTLADKASSITSVNDEGFAAVKKELQLKRKEISDGMFQARSELNRMSKGIIEVEKTLLDIFVPAEQNLIALDKAEKERLIKEARLEALPQKRERITQAGIEFTDEEILAMADADFELEFATRLSAKAVAEQSAAEAKLAEERAAFEAEKAELARRQAEADAIENARKEERERAEKALQLAKETAERELKETEERHKAEEQERIDHAQKELDEAKVVEAKREADKKYQAFLTKNNYNSEEDIIVDVDAGVAIYRFVAAFKNK